MPKCETDPALHEQVHLFIRENGLTISGAATQLGVDRTTLWRFCGSGRARGDTRALYRGAIENRSKNPAAAVASVAVKGDVPAVHGRTALRGRLESHELNLIRKVCEGVFALLDDYEAKGLGGEN